MTPLAEMNDEIEKHNMERSGLRQQTKHLLKKERAGIVQEVKTKIAQNGLPAG